jgi:predicted acyltransferase
MQAMRQRLVSLDVMRGLTVALMIQVNNPGSWYWRPVYQLTHAPWHGCTLTDLVFPFFLFAMGGAMALSVERRRLGGEPPASLLKHAARRGLTIVFIGLVLNAFPFGLPLDPTAARAFSFSSVVTSLADLRLPGVLQRIGAAWLLATPIIILLPQRRRRIAAGVALVLLYELVMRLPLVEGWGRGSFEAPDNLARWIDLHILGAAHMLSVGVKGGSDPEGLLPTLNAAATTLLGFATVAWLGREALSWRRLLRLGLAGLGVAAVARLAVPLEPINKSLWTTTYVLFSGGLAMTALAASAWLVDVSGWRRPLRPFEAAGYNPMLMFFGSGLLARVLLYSRWSVGGAKPEALRTLLYEHAFVPWAGQEWGSLLFATAQVILWMAVAWQLYRRGWAWRV